MESKKILKGTFNKDKNGFTLLELLVVMFIIGLLSALMMADYAASQKKYQVDKAVQSFVANLRRAQSLALSGAQSQADDGSYVSGAGVHIENGAASYAIFADTVAAGNEKYVFSQGSTSYRYDSNGVQPGSLSPRCQSPQVSYNCDRSASAMECGSSFSGTAGDVTSCYDRYSSFGSRSRKYVKTPPIVITGDKILETIFLPPGITISPSADIFFEPPRPTTHIDYRNGNDGASSKVFTLTNGVYGKNVTVYLSGRIDIE